MKALRSLIEKAVWTYVQAVATLALVGGSLVFNKELAIAALPAALTVVANGMPAVAVGLPFKVDLALRVVRSYAAAFLGFLLSQPVFHLDASVGKAASMAGVMAVLVVVKGVAAKQVGDPNTAATLPASG
jgi:hypothetical protein